jgi:hypothetical protein
MENSGIFKTMKRQWNILITGTWLDGMENSEIFKTVRFSKQWKDNGTFWYIYLKIAKSPSLGTGLSLASKDWRRPTDCVAVETGVMLEKQH